MSGPTIAFFPEGAYGPTNNCVGIARVLRERGARVVFVVEESFAGTLEAQILFVAGEQTSSLRFRLDQLDAVDDLGEELLLRFEERDGIAKVATLTANGLDVELFHILTFT